ncbi:PGF-pre-PGF domain-containing protein [Candidatus Woesearchaeota archaeon]|nr:PGF-pre-PGF domain-containing protein [Candidatus Woesearchaeota archaeon]
MKKEGKLSLIFILIASFVFLLVYIVMVFGNAGVNSNFPVNETNASSSAGVGSTVHPSMAGFNGTNPLFRCNISTTNNGSNTNITNVSLFIMQTPIADINTAKANQTININDSTTAQVINFSFPKTLGEGLYYWACRAEDNQSNGCGGGTCTSTYNSTVNRTLIIDNTAPGFFNLTNTSISTTTVSTETVIYVSVNATDSFTSINILRLFANTTSTANNQVNISGGTSGVTADNSTMVNLSFKIPGIAINQIINLTIQANDSVGNVNITSAILFFVAGDATVPGPITLNSPIGFFNQSTATAPTFNFTASDNNDTSLSCTINISMGGSNFTHIQNLNVTNGTAHVNTTSVPLSNGTYVWNVSCVDSPGNFNVSVFSNFTVDQIPPRHIKFNLSSNATGDGIDAGDIIGSITLSEVPAGRGGTGAQGRKIVAFANITDNLTRPFHAALQFYNGTTWTTLNTTKNLDNEINITNSATNANSSVVLNFTPPTGHNEFEGRNVSFRIIVNDTLGNINTSAEVMNITVNINDTTKPTVTINGTIATNGTNTTNTLPLVSWSLVEGTSLTEVNASVDGVITDDGCNKFKRFTTTANENRNFSFTPTNSPSCTLANGSHFIKVESRDSWSNVEVVFHNFTVQSGSAPGLVFNNITHLNGVDTEINPVNKTNISSRMGMNFSGFGGSASVSSLTYVSSCNSSATVTFGNGSVIFPFNESDCPTTTGNRTLKVTVTDTAGNSNSTVFGFLLDNAPPSIAVQLPTQGSSVRSNVSINLTVQDNSLSPSFVGYYLDGSTTVQQLNFTAGQTGQGNGSLNISYNRTISFNPGTHTIKFTANDTLGNAINTSIITFTALGGIRPNEINSSLSVFLGNLMIYPANATIRLKGAGGDYQDVGTANETDASGTFEISLYLNQTSANTQVNVTITDINGSGANWDKINFSMFINESKFETQVQNNFTADIFAYVVFNASFEEFLPNRNDYSGVVLLPFNISNELALAKEIWFFPNSSKLTGVSDRVNVSNCTSAFTKTTDTPCWNYTTGGKTLVFVPHFSGVGAGNDSLAPTVNVTTPTQNFSGLSMFDPNITVSADAISCLSSLNGTVANVTMAKSGNICLGQTERLKNLNLAEAGYNFTFTVTDSSGNINRYVWRFNVSDETAPNTPNSTRISVSESSTSATVTISGMNESVNASITAFSGSSNATSTIATPQTDFNTTQEVSFPTLTASTTYHMNITVCDFAGNCATNSTNLAFTTSAAAATTTTTTTTTSSGGGGGGAAAPSNVAAETSKKWDTLAEGSSAVLSINNANIAVTGVVIDVKSAVTSAEVKVASLTANPLSTAAAGKVYQYLQLTRSNIADTDASKITINFKVPKSWLSTNAIAEGDVVLYRYSDSKWNALSTAMSGSDANNVLYSAVTPGFSTFAIGNKEAAPAAAPAAEAPSEAPTAPAGEAPAAPEGKPAEEAAMEKKGLSTTAIAWIVVAVIVVRHWLLHDAEEEG